MHAESFERFCMEIVSKSLGFNVMPTTKYHLRRKLCREINTLRRANTQCRANLAKRLELETALVEDTDTPPRPSKRNTHALNSFTHASKSLL